MPASRAPNSVAPLAERLRSASDELTDEWLRRLGERLGVRPRRLLPTEQLRDHIPAVLLGMADYLEWPIDQIPNETVDIIRTLTQLRREQGYDVQEIVSEIDVLGDLVSERIANWVDEMEDPLTPQDAIGATARICKVLRTVLGVAVGTYREEELRQDRELARRLDEFASMIAHEFRSPLSAIGMSAELLAEEEVARAAHSREKHAQRIRDRLERVWHLVDDVRALAIAEGARAEPRWVAIQDVVGRIFEEVETVAKRHDVRLQFDVGEADFQVDAARVEIALMNLVVNAIKFCDEGKSERWVRLGLGPAESQGLEGGRRITVADNGVGIQPASHNKVFQRFFREHPDVEGTGLGLSITKSVVEQRGGRLWFESVPGEGTTFFMEIPQRLEREESQGEARR
jgi:signal transduction histidine kinase